MIGIVGFGRFGRLAAEALAEDFEVVVATRNSQRKAQVAAAGARWGDLEQACRQQVVILCVPISAMEQTLGRVAGLLAPGALVVDVCSVKVLPVRWMQRLLPDHVEILATHPMFGPDSAGQGLAGHKIVLCPVRVADRRLRAVWRYLEQKGLVVIRASAEEHDRNIAVSLGLTHFIGRALAAFGARPLHIDTEGYKRLLHILEVVENDTWQLFCDMHRFNPYANDCRRAFFKAMEQVEARLKDGPD